MKILFVDDLVPWRKLLVELFKEDGSDYEIIVKPGTALRPWVFFLMGICQISSSQI